jgi:hypothetical protein
MRRMSASRVFTSISRRRFDTDLLSTVRRIEEAIAAIAYVAEESEETAKLFLLLQDHSYSPLSQRQIEDLRQHFPPDPEFTQ